MPEYLAPGVYVEELPSHTTPIHGVSTGTAGFVGAAERGPTTAVTVTSFAEYTRWYGGASPSSFLADAVLGFFENAGQRGIVVRVVAANGTTATATIGNLALTARGPGDYGNRIRVAIEHPAETEVAAPPGGFRVSIQSDGVRETFDWLTAEQDLPSDVLGVLNTQSRVIRAAWTDAGAAKPPAQGFTALVGGSDGTIVANDYVRALEILADDDDVALVVVPDQARAGMDAVTAAVIDQCEASRNRLALVSAPQGQSDVAKVRPPRDTSYAAYYYPWVEVVDAAAAGGTKLVPATGHVAGVLARVDRERGVGKAPANEAVRGVVGLELPATSQTQETLHLRGVNAIRDFQSVQQGIRLWGARTMASDGEARYVHLRRFFIFLEQSIARGTQWVVFEPNAEPTWEAVRRSVEALLTAEWRSGALQGATPEEAFIVTCDRTTMTQADLEAGRLVCLIGIAAVRPAEFVILRLCQWTADAT